MVVPESEHLLLPFLLGPCSERLYSAEESIHRIYMESSNEFPSICTLVPLSSVNVPC